MHFSIFLYVFCHLSLRIYNVKSYKILGLFPYPGKSHYALYDPFMVELANRGHNVIVYNTFPKSYSIPNYTEVDISHCHAFSSEANIDQMKNIGKSGFNLMDLLVNVLPKYEEIAKCEPLMNLWNNSEKYDVLVTEMFHNEVSLLFGEKLNLPIVGFHSTAPLPWHSEQMGLPQNPSYLSVDFNGYLSKMNFFERLSNTLMHYYTRFLYELRSRAVYNKMSREIFGDSISTMAQVSKKVSLLLVGIHSSYGYPRPLVPNVIEVAGLHIKPAQKLNENIEKFINESEQGVVYFCLGSLLRAETIPSEKREAFLYAFSKIPQRVLWKWEGETLPGKSDNIMISKWMPQRDILAHPNIKLFISHGGLLGTSEAVYESVPVLGIPIFGDQRSNIKSLEANGAGELLDYNEISKEVVLEKIQKLLRDPKYKENAKRLSERYRDRPMSPLDTAVYWTEYVIRHKGAPHLRTAVADMPWYQYLLLDVMAFSIALLVIGLMIIYYSIKFTIKLIRKLGNLWR